MGGSGTNKLCRFKDIVGGVDKLCCVFSSLFVFFLGGVKATC